MIFFSAKVKIMSIRHFRQNGQHFPLQRKKDEASMIIPQKPVIGLSGFNGYCFYVSEKYLLSPMLNI